MKAGSLRAILREIKYGTVFTVIDELLHSWLFDWIIGNCEWRYGFCQWSHRSDTFEEK